MKRKIIKLTITIITMCITLLLIVKYIKCVNDYNEYNYLLQEIEPGIYATYYQTHSNVPANNYEVIIICYNDNVYTLNGDVSITYTDNTPYVYIKDTNISNGDEIHIYVPKGTVRYNSGVNIGK